MKGDGIRKAGVLQPSTQKLLDQVGNEQITSLTVWREPLAYSKFLRAIKKDLYHDELFHLALNINGKYNLEKNGQNVGFYRGSSKGETMSVNVPSNLTINELFDKTRKRMGDTNFTKYTVEKLNCQDFVDNILSAIGSNTGELKKFILQDAEKIVDKLGGKWAKALAGAFTTFQEAVSVAQEGGCGKCSYGKGCSYGEGGTTLYGSGIGVGVNNGLPLCKIQY